MKTQLLSFFILFFLAGYLHAQNLTPIGGEDSSSNLKIGTLKVFHGKNMDLDALLDGTQLSSESIGAIIYSKQESDVSLGLLAVNDGVSDHSIGIVGIARGLAKRKEAIIAEARGKDGFNIGVLSTASDGINNIGMVSEASGSGVGNINIGVVSTALSNSDSPGVNFGFMAKAFGNGDKTDTYFNTAVSARASGSNNKNIAVHAAIRNEIVKDSQNVTCMDSRNYGFLGEIDSKNSQNYGINVLVKGSESTNTGLFCRVEGGSENIAAIFEGDIYFNDAQQQGARFRWYQDIGALSNGKGNNEYSDIGPYTFSSGMDCEVYGKGGSAIGINLISKSDGQFVTGMYNYSLKEPDPVNPILFSVGNGAESARNNAIEVYENGSVKLTRLFLTPSKKESASYVTSKVKEATSLLEKIHCQEFFDKDSEITTYAFDPPFIEKDFPGLFIRAEQGLPLIDYLGFIPIMVAGFQEQVQLLDQKEAKIASLEEDIELMKIQLEKLSMAIKALEDASEN